MPDVQLPDPPPELAQLRLQLPPPEQRSLALSTGSLHGWSMREGKRLAALSPEEGSATGGAALDRLHSGGYLTSEEKDQLRPLVGLHAHPADVARHHIHEVHGSLGPDASPAAVIIAQIAKDSADAHAEATTETLIRTVIYDVVGAAVGVAIGALGGPILAAILGFGLACAASGYADATGG